MINFEGFSLSQNLKNSLARMNFTEPTPIQVSSIPLALEGRDILGFMVGNIESENILIGKKGIVRGDLHFENNLTVLEGADISGHVQKLLV